MQYPRELERLEPIGERDALDSMQAALAILEHKGLPLRPFFEAGIALFDVLAHEASLE